MQHRMQPGEKVLAQDGAQLARGTQQGAAGELYLTSQRLVLIPNQLASFGRGELFEVPLERIQEIRKHGAFQGGTLLGIAGRKIEVLLDDGSIHTFSFFPGADVSAFHAALHRRLSGGAPVVLTAQSAQAPAEFPRPRRRVLFWVRAVILAAVAIFLGVLVVNRALEISRNW